MNTDTAIMEPVENVEIEAVGEIPAGRSRQVVASAVIRPPVEPKTLGSIFTMVIWVGCLLVGTLGFALPYDRPHQAVAVEQPAVELINVELADNPPPDQ